MVLCLIFFIPAFRVIVHVIMDSTTKHVLTIIIMTTLAFSDGNLAASSVTFDFYQVPAFQAVVHVTMK